MPRRLTVAERLERMPATDRLLTILTATLKKGWATLDDGGHHPLAILEHTFLTDAGDICETKMREWGDLVVSQNDLKRACLEGVDWVRIKATVAEQIKKYESLQVLREVRALCA